MSQAADQAKAAGSGSRNSLMAWTTFAQLYKAWAYRQDQLPSTHPIAADIPDIDAVEVNFDGITYAKGASVLKQLVAYVGRDNFLAGVRQYFADNEWGNATLADLLLALEDTSGRDLTGWSREWLQTAGVNTLRPEYELDDQGRFTDDLPAAICWAAAWDMARDGELRARDFLAMAVTGTEFTPPRTSRT